METVFGQDQGEYFLRTKNERKDALIENWLGGGGKRATSLSIGCDQSWKRKINHDPMGSLGVGGKIKVTGGQGSTTKGPKITVTRRHG